MWNEVEAYHFSRAFITWHSLHDSRTIGSRQITHARQKEWVSGAIEWAGHFSVFINNVLAPCWDLNFINSFVHDLCSHILQEIMWKSVIDCYLSVVRYFSYSSILFLQLINNEIKSFWFFFLIMNYRNRWKYLISSKWNSLGRNIEIILNCLSPFRGWPKGSWAVKI